MSAENISYDLKRFAGIKRDYTPQEVERLRGSIKIEYSLCKQQSIKLWKLLNTENYVNIFSPDFQDFDRKFPKTGLMLSTGSAIAA